MTSIAPIAGFAVLALYAVQSAAMPGPAQPPISSRVAKILTIDGRQFRDLNKNGQLDPYEDWRLPVAKRVEDLITRMSLPEKAGLMMVAVNFGFAGPNGAVLDTLAPPPPGALKSPVNVVGVPGFDRSDKPSPHDLILTKHVRWIGPSLGGAPADAARWANNVQAIAETDRLGVPVVLIVDPIHTTNRLPGGDLPPADRVKITSSWPDQIGFAAIGDPAVTKRFGQIAAAELTAMGVHMVANPIADTATEPRWNRIPGTFGEDATLNAKLVAAYVEGFQGSHIGPRSVLTAVKHFPGDGPVKNGLDPHNPYGKDLAYPAGMQDYHLKPFRAGIAAGTATVMTSYGIPDGIDTVGSSFSKPIVTGLLRQKLGFQGIVLSDWLHAMPWGVEKLSKQDREARMIAAGVDQFGGEHETSYVINLVETGKVSRARLDESMRHILRPMFELGLFENPYVDPDQASKIVNSSAFREAGEDAQRRAIVLLKNQSSVLPLKSDTKLLLSGFAKVPPALAPNAVSSVDQADVTIVKISAPFQVNKSGTAFFKITHEGSLVYADAENASDLQKVVDAEKSGKPVIVVLSLERPAVLSEFLGKVSAVLATFGSDDDAVAAILTGAATPRAKLPFDLPADEAAVETQKEDAPHDFARTLFHQGFGLTYSN